MAAKLTFWAILVAFLCYIEPSNAQQVSCLDEDGEPVDWIIGYKFPLLDAEVFDTGFAYSFITSKDVKDIHDDYLPEHADYDTKLFIYTFKDLLFRFIGGKSKTRAWSRAARRSKQVKYSRWVLSDKLLNDPSSVIMRTLAIAYDEDLLAEGTLNSIFYNDDPNEPEPQFYEDSGEEVRPQKKKKANIRRAHAKGVLLMDEVSGNGVWLSHSVPRFPEKREGGTLNFLKGSGKFGQTFMCISFDIHKSGQQIVDHLVNMRPLVYDVHVSENMLNMIPNLTYLDLEENLKYTRMQSKPKLSQLIVTRSGQPLYLFSKSRELDEDMYLDYIDNELRSALYVETWRRGSGDPLNSSCPRDDYHVNNVLYLRYNDQIAWSYLNDHSKWAITDEEKSGFVCISDINRMQSQFKRGGGAICIKSPTCWSIFSNTILDTEPCPYESRKKEITNSDDNFLIDLVNALHL